MRRRPGNIWTSNPRKFKFGLSLVINAHLVISKTDSPLIVRYCQLQAGNDCLRRPSLNGNKINLGKSMPIKQLGRKRVIFKKNIDFINILLSYRA